MKNIIIHHRQVPAEHAPTVNAFPFVANAPFDGEPSWIVEEQHLGEVLAAIGVSSHELSSTPYSGIYKVSLVFADGSTAPTYRIYFRDGWNGQQNHENVRSLVKEILMPVVQKNIMIRVPHQSAYPPFNDGNFHIFIWSQKSGPTTVKPPENIFGIKCDCRDTGFAPSGEGIPIIDPDTGYVVAELLDNNLYIHYDIVEKGTQRELDILRIIFTRVVETFNLTAEERAEYERQRIELQLRRNRESYINACINGFQKYVQTIRSRIQQNQSSISQYQTELVNKLRQVRMDQDVLAKMSDDESKKEKFATEYDKLITMEKIVKVEATDKKIMVFTENLYCTNPNTGKIHDIGKFRIEIPIDGAGGVRWFNLTRRVDGHGGGMQAPHVFNEGNACLGNTETIFPELIANHEYMTVAMLAIQFVESVNMSDSAGRYIVRWPIYEPPTEPVPEGVTVAEVATPAVATAAEVEVGSFDDLDDYYDDEDEDYDGDED